MCVRCLECKCISCLDRYGFLVYLIMYAYAPKLKKKTQLLHTLKYFLDKGYSASSYVSGSVKLVTISQCPLLAGRGLHSHSAHIAPIHIK